MMHTRSASHSVAVARLGARWRAAGTGLVRRTALAREVRPEGIGAPPLRLFLAELAALATGRVRMSRGATLDALARRPQPVMLLPGFGAHPKRMNPLRDGLARAGHHVEDWGMGINFGPTPANFAFLVRRVEALARAHGEPITLVGWSLGGLFAREIAHRLPHAVARVVTMGTPFSGDMRANNAWRAYQLVTGHSVSAPPIDCHFALKPPVPTVALWSPRDGVVHTRSASGWPGERDRAVSLRCTHLGFASDPAVIAAVLRELDRD